MKSRDSVFFSNRLTGLCLALGGLCFSAGCGPDKEEIIREKVAERVTTFKQKETAKCREALLSTAEHIVDSLLLSEALLGVSDSLARSRPVKPVKPQAVPTIDSSPVEPLFKH